MRPPGQNCHVCLGRRPPAECGAEVRLSKRRLSDEQHSGCPLIQAVDNRSRYEGVAFSCRPKARGEHDLRDRREARAALPVWQ
eukprot:scaffold234524_cov35-Tisochrysis_lutea.AAC.1